MTTIEDFIQNDNEDISFLSEASETVEVEVTIDRSQEGRSLVIDWNRLRNSRDDYDELLVYADREIVLEEGEYVLRRSVSKKLVTENSFEDPNNAPE